MTQQSGSLLRPPGLAAPVAVAPQALSSVPALQGGGAVSTTRVITYTYVYDSVGNRTAMTKTIASTVAFTHVYEYDAANRLTNVDDQA